MTRFVAYTFLILFAISSCGPRESTSSNSEEKDISELTYFELWQLLLEGHGGAGIDVHGEGFGSEAVSSLEVTQGDACDCGQLLSVQNDSDRAVSAIISAAFSLPGNPTNKIDRIYEIPANSSVLIGCSHICYDGRAYVADRRIVSAGFDAGE